MAKRPNYAAMERQDTTDPAPVGYFWIRDINGKNRRTVTCAQYRAEVNAAKARAISAFNLKRAEG